MKEEIIVVGGGGHAKVVIDIIEKMNIYNISAIVVKENLEKPISFNYPVLFGDHHLESLYKKGISKAAIGIGGFRDNILRKKIYDKLKIINYCIINVIDPSANISKTVKFGEGNVIFPGVILNTDVSIENNVIIATGSTVDHETVIKSHSLISAGVTIGAYCKIEESVLLALGSITVSGVTIGANSLIAAGAVVIRDVEKNCQVFGIPAKKKRDE